MTTYPSIAVGGTPVNLEEISYRKPKHVTISPSLFARWLAFTGKLIVGCIGLAVVGIVLSLILWTPIFLALSGFLLCLAGTVILLARYKMATHYLEGGDE